MKQTKEKLQYLEKLLKIYVKFFKHYKKILLTYNDKAFIVKYYDSTGIGGSYEFKEEEIPMKDLDAYILRIRRKVDYSFKKRFSNKYIK